MNMKRFYCLLGCGLICLVVLSGCLQETATRSYTNDTYEFSLNPPVGWREVENHGSEVIVKFSPQNSSDVSLTIGIPFTIGEGRALSTYADQIEENLSESGMNYTILFRDWRSISQLQAYEIAYSYDGDGTQRYVKQVAILRTRTVFLITFTAPLSVSGQYGYEVNESIDTFQ
jgi:hypothetical protein